LAGEDRAQTINLTIDLSVRRVGQFVKCHAKTRDHRQESTFDGQIHPLFAAEIPRLRRYARVLLRNRDRADDLVQDTLLRDLEKLHLCQPGSNLRAWLFAVMHNLYVNSHRRAARQGQAIQVEKARLSTPPSQVSKLELRDLERALASLPEDQRTTLLLIGLEGLTYEEVA
jgi:RNA polymerase sigma-70 factor (ECF subfamily)